MDRLKLRTVAHHTDRRFIQYVSQPLSAAIADVAFTLMFSRLILNNRVSGQFLELFGIIETLNVPYFCHKYNDCF